MSGDETAPKTMFWNSVSCELNCVTTKGSTSAALSPLASRSRNMRRAFEEHLLAVAVGRVRQLRAQAERIKILFELHQRKHLGDLLGQLFLAACARRFVVDPVGAPVERRIARRLRFPEDQRRHGGAFGRRPERRVPEAAQQRIARRAVRKERLGADIADAPAGLPFGQRQQGGRADVEGARGRQDQARDELTDHLRAVARRSDARRRSRAGRS